MFIPEIGKDWCFNGLNRPNLGSLIVCSEVAARYYGELISEYKNLPNIDYMKADIKYQKEYYRVAFPRHFESISALIEVDKRMDELAQLSGFNFKGLRELKLFAYHPYV